MKNFIKGLLSENCCGFQENGEGFSRLLTRPIYNFDQAADLEAVVFYQASAGSTVFCGQSGPESGREPESEKMEREDAIIS
jgi:hypothetical protein